MRVFRSSSDDVFEFSGRLIALLCARLSRVRTIGASLNSADGGSEHYWANADAVLRYLLKYTDMETGEALGLARYGEAGKVVGKRCGSTRNVGTSSNGAR